MSLIDRMVFGTARLSGGPYARQSRQLIEACLKAGIRRFDTAPSYGMGAAEALLGEVTAGVADVRIHTKAGSPRPSHPAFRGWAKRVYNLVRAARPAPPPALVNHAGPAPGFDYRAEALRASISRSLATLRRDRVDALLLHEAEPGEVTRDAWQVFVHALATGQASRIGYAHFGPLRHADGGGENGAPVAQIAPRAADFLAPRTGPLIYHSIRVGAIVASGGDSRVADRLEDVAQRHGLREAGETGRYLAAIACLAETAPGALHVFATTDGERLRALLERAADIEGPPS